MREGRVLGVEALLRWNHPEQGLLLPAHFLPLIEHTGLSASRGRLGAARRRSAAGGLAAQRPGH